MKEIRISVGGNCDETISSQILNSLYPTLQANFSCIDYHLSEPKKGELGIETACLIIGTATSTLALLYTIIKDTIDRRKNNTNSDGEFKLTVTTLEAQNSLQIRTLEEALAIDSSSLLEHSKTVEIQITFLK
jgi:hypothetical protein